MCAFNSSIVPEAVGGVIYEARVFSGKKRPLLGADCFHLGTIDKNPEAGPEADSRRLSLKKR